MSSRSTDATADRHPRPVAQLGGKTTEVSSAADLDKN
jgi:hypothetical protein